MIVNTKAFSATAGNDFTSLTNSLVSFAEGEVSKTVKIAIPNDNIKEFPENFTVSLSSPTGGLILADSGTASVTIVDDDSPSGTVTPGVGAPELTLTANSRINKSRFIRTGFPFTVECDENCTVRATVTVTQGIARRYGLSSTILATNISRLTADNDKQLNATPRSSIARRLQSRRGSIPATLTVTARGTNGSGSDVETKRFNIADDIVRRNN